MFFCDRGKYKFEMYKDKKGEWRWRFIAPNGRIMADSGEGYRLKIDCLDAIKTIKRCAKSAKIVLIEIED